MNALSQQTDILCVGETLIDFIGEQAEEPLSDTRDYHRYLGGSPSNVAMNMSRLGLNVQMAATVGADGFGDYILQRFEESNVKTDCVAQISTHQTTIIFVNRTINTPDFLAIRGADSQIQSSQIPASVLLTTRLFHTSCFALSEQPARGTILEKAKQAKEAGCQLSIDVNYSARIWPDTAEAAEVISAYCRLEPLLKLSQDDSDRLFGAGITHDELFKKLHALGAKVVCLTLGGKGAKLSEEGDPVLELSALKVDKIMDATGAGDAFWSGFLFSWLKGKSNQICMETALKMAAIKLQNVGRIPDYGDVITTILKTN